MFHFEADSCNSQLGTEPAGWRSNSPRPARLMAPAEAEEGEGGWQKGAAPGRPLTPAGIITGHLENTDNGAHFEAITVIISATDLSGPEQTLSSLWRECSLIISESLGFHRVVWTKETFFLNVCEFF